MNATTHTDASYDYKGHTISRRFGTERSWEVTWLRPDGYSAEPRGFRSEAEAKAWIDWMESLSA